MKSTVHTIMVDTWDDERGERGFGEPDDVKKTTPSKRVSFSATRMGER